MKISHYITNPNNSTDLQQNNRDKLIKNAENNGGHGSSTANKRPLGTGLAEYDDVRHSLYNYDGASRY